ncbi:hypothetical protein BD309DRAFT_963044 [Dichomitus squalens]|nr:hypothetical protein BD309DRAFT_963044 [Dichomitus squalens]
MHMAEALSCRKDKSYSGRCHAMCSCSRSRLCYSCGSLLVMLNYRSRPLPHLQEHRHQGVGYHCRDLSQRRI